ncbi:DUF4062 domain-containing protein [Aeromicrobium fastidiosum]|uniref:DUF4062 domain-containing protein n=1 Tax=Aeromicrobium fastidiosum TaxID=52699 RepID=UPI00165FEAF2|nr:DUF4062 domain-containing protein [Aeromicrobium fastidiosum]MBP2390815.1 hypothetical protein [Aeromicrobium fastidiosum]
MEKELRELRVFMGSPGDLTDERDALRDLERRLNAMFRARGVRVSIEGWEEVQPDAGAPQELINPLVHDCDVFVGLLNMRWGTPTDNESSGFSEEFNIALRRRTENGTAPAIGMYFRDIDPDRLRDTGPQLEAVLAFKERVEAERLVLHKPFSNADHLTLEVMNFLLPHVLRLADEVSPGAADQREGSSGSTPADDGPKALEAGEAKSDDDSDDTPDELDSAQRQIVSALTSFSSAFSNRVPFDPNARDRVTLAASAFAKDVGTLGSHHVNRLFSNRDKLDLTVGEIEIWYRTFFQNYGAVERDYRIIPIWGVAKPDRLGDRLVTDLGALTSDDDQNVVRGVLRFMTEQQVRPESFWQSSSPGTDADSDSDAEDALVESQTSEHMPARWGVLFERFPGIDSALNYMVAVARPEDAELLTSVAESDTIDDRTRTLIRVAIGAMTGDLSSVAEITPSRYSGNDTTAVRDLVVNSIPQLSAEQCDGLLTASHRTIARAAALQIVSREDVSPQQLKTIFELGSADVERAIVERSRRDPNWSVSQIQELTELDRYGSADLVSRILAATQPREALERKNRDETLSATTWVALTIQDPESYLESARNVLDDTSDWLNERNAPLMEKYAAIAHSTTATARGAACTVLSQAAEVTEADVERVVTELRRDSYVSRISALRALVAMVSRLDADPDRTVPNLGDLSMLDSFRFSDDTGLVLDSPLAGMVAPVWRSSEIQALREASGAWELRQPEMSDTDLEESLYLDSQHLRMAALDQLMSRWNDTQLEELLNRYDDQDRPWWYNIIAALDDRLYGFGRQASNEDGE